MLVIRMQRTGRKGHAQFRVVVQDSRRTPTSGKVVASIGSYDPHTKQTIIDKTKVETYLSNGAQPSERVARLLKSEGVKLPDWVKLPADKKRTIRNADKLRKNRPAEPATEPEAAAQLEEPAAEVVTDEAPVEAPAEASAAEEPAAAPEAPVAEADAEKPAEA